MREVHGPIPLALGERDVFAEADETVLGGLPGARAEDGLDHWVDLQAQWPYHQLDFRLYVSRRRVAVALMHLRSFGD